jgi:hypothetical protein
MLIGLYLLSRLKIVSAFGKQKSKNILKNEQ